MQEHVSRSFVAFLLLSYVTQVPLDLVLDQASQIDIYQEC